MYSQITEELIRKRLDTISDLRYKAPDKALEIAEKNYLEAQQLSNDTLIGKATNLYGIQVWMASDYYKAKKLFKEAISLFNDKQKLAPLMNLGIINAELGKLDSAYFYMNNVIQEKLRNGEDSTRIITPTTNLAEILRVSGNYAEAIEKLSSIKSLVYNSTDIQKIITFNNTLGVLLINIEDYQSALEVFHENIELAESDSNIVLKAKAISNIGLIYSHQKKYELAREYYQKSLALKKDANNKKTIGVTTFNIAESYLHDNDLIQAEQYTIQSLNLFSEIDNKKGLVLSNKLLGDIYSAQKLYKQADKRYGIAEELGNEINIKDDLTHLYSSISAHQEKQGNYLNALNYYKKYFELNDSLFDEKKQKRIDVLKIQLERYKDQAEIQQQQDIIEKNNHKLKNRAIILTFLAIIALLLGFLWIISKIKNRNQKLANKLLQEKFEEFKASNIHLATNRNETNNDNEAIKEITLTNRNKDILQLKDILHISTKSGTGTAYYYCKTEDKEYVKEDSQTLKNLVKILAPYGFVQIHKSHIVNSFHITKHASKDLLLSNESSLPIGRSFKENLNNMSFIEKPQINKKELNSSSVKGV